jgi:hypothetical protein
MLCAMVPSRGYAVPRFFAHVPAALLNASSTLERRRARTDTQPHMAIVLPRHRRLCNCGETCDGHRVVVAT